MILLPPAGWIDQQQRQTDTRSALVGIVIGAVGMLWLAVVQLLVVAGVADSVWAVVVGLRLVRLDR